MISSRSITPKGTLRESAVGVTLRINATNRALAESSDPSDTDVVRGFIASLNALPGVYGLLLGYDDGNYIHIESMAAIPKRLRVHDHIPERSAYRLTRIRREGEERIQQQSWLDAAGVPVADAVVTRNPSYDPRNRPWYNDRPKNVPVSMSDLYVFFTLKVPGYTVAVPVAGNVQGVLAADILLSSLEDFLKAERISPSARVVLLEEHGAVASAGDLTDLMRKSGYFDKRGDLILPPLSILGYPPIEAAVRDWDGRSQFHDKLTVEGRDYIASIRSVDSELAKGLRVVAIAPLDEFFGQIGRLRFRSLLYALAVTLAAIPVAIEIGRRITRQLAAVADDAQRIRRFDVEPGKPIRSHLIEIDLLADSVARAKSAVRDFSRFVPRSLVKHAIESGTALELGGDRRELTILFTDAVDFTTLAEKADATQLTHHASRYLAALSMAITDKGGTIDKYIGDSIMAFWNAPVPDGDHVARGCEAVLSCREANRRLNEEFVAEGWPAMRTRYGLHSGDVVVGNIGSEDRMNYTAIGAAVNLASRLEALNSYYGTDVLVSEAVVTRVQHRFRFRRIGRVLPKGMTETLSVYALLGPKGGAGASEISHQLGRWEAIVSKCDELNWVEALSGLETYLDLYPEDEVARKCRERCIGFLRGGQPLRVASDVGR